MKDIDESTLLAYADGALTPDQAGRVEAVLASDPQRAADVRQLQQVKARLRNGYASVLEEPIPAHLLDAARQRPPASPQTSVVTATAPIQAPATRQHARRRWTVPTSIAAALLIGLWLWQRQPPQPAPSALLTEQGHDASGTLALALDRQLSGEQQGKIRMGLSFRAHDGRYCRSFSLQSSHAGLACRQGERWRIEVVSPLQPQGNDSELRMASSTLPAALLDAIDARIDGQALDAEGERGARARHWR
ncbi:anti-sigma factor family protein [Xanthomonas oryzae]|uniref:anti-sigma factor family protein n=1 Tax=Xanthomonas oryzae TaxID=347 RepID=UPI000949F513|nr:hypothetical protein [Xanthomonas oryzae]OLG30635.1 hypothetical protein BXO6_17780 [Xanthomonas oryzae pv. oryzae]PNR70532.1 hypothetical protein LA20_05630 [Xanthomonas oryzae pv. oryzae]PNR76054.1 hypothetical protein LA21_05810 [Xanthomonas oryzae pv. oryzae]PNR77500.1 hypothetical protein LA22_06010 [Xanthomonas oryzae pv. oryzae]PNR88454.1 hypothetical protein LA09_10345 [Xanthomonas oryzae pv. oryzae]